MKKLTLILILSPILVYSQLCDSLLLESITGTGPFLVNSYDESAGIQNGNGYTGSTIYYPVNNASHLPGIVIVPGFMNTEITIANWGPFLASYGIITMTIGTNLLTDGHTERRDALIDAIISLKNENIRIGSPLYHKLDTSSIAVGGFSKGGGGAQLVPNIEPNIKTVVALYPWLENATLSDLNHDVPTIIISGQLDVFAPPAMHADVHYNLIPNTTKKLKYEIAFASHDAVSGPYAGGGEVGVRILAWLNTFLVSDSCYCPITLIQASTSSSYITNVECNTIILNSLSLNNLSVRKLLKITDFLGRKTNESGIPLFYFYNDGTVEKRLVFE